MKIFGYRVTGPAFVGMVIVLANIAIVLFAPLIAPYDQAAFVGDVWAPPSRHALLGLDNLGRDMFSRMMYGGRMSVSLAFVICMLAFFIGVTGGFSAAIAGRWVDLILSRFVDICMSIPTLILALIILSALGTSIPVLILTIAGVESTRIFRIARSVALEVVLLDYVEVAKLRGDPLWKIIFREVLPNTLPPLVAEFGIRFCYTLLFVSSLSFLGLGIQPPMADWGSLVKDNALAINFGGMAPIYPAAAVAILAIGVNLVVDWYISLGRHRADTETAPVHG
ncbi:ABC transporter permease [Pseudorhodoplanes sp.]|uniref:ABC transporter permease n=1 Tax=Pseudorhodoplanes sp. TaxID=1934341 RepID=UPI003D1160D3